MFANFIEDYIFVEVEITEIKCYGFADLKSSNLYEHLPVQTKMSILSSMLTLLPILLCELFMHNTHIKN